MFLHAPLHAVFRASRRRPLQPLQLHPPGRRADPHDGARMGVQLFRQIEMLRNGRGELGEFERWTLESLVGLELS